MEYKPFTSSQGREPADDITDDIWELLKSPYEEPAEDCADPPDKYVSEEPAPNRTFYIFLRGFFVAQVAQLVKMLLELL